MLVVVLSKTWDGFLYSFVWPTVFFDPEYEKLNCSESLSAFFGTVAGGAVLLTVLFSCTLPWYLGKLMPATVAMLSGWSFKTALTTCHDTEEALMVRLLMYVVGEARLSAWTSVDVAKGEVVTPMFDLVFAVACTLFAALLVLLASSLRRLKLLSDVPGAAELVGRLTSLLSGTLGLGVAAMYELSSQELFGLPRYASFLRSAAERELCMCHTGAIERSGGVLAIDELRLPGLLTLSVQDAVTRTTLLALCVMRLEQVKQRGLQDLDEARAEVNHQTAQRGMVLIRIKVRQLQSFVRRREGWLAQARASAVKTLPLPKLDEVLCTSNAGRSRRLTRAQRRRLLPEEGSAHVHELAVSAAEREPWLAPPVQTVMANAARQQLLEIRAAVYELLEKTMGFLVGWSFYDVLAACFGVDRSARVLTSTPVRDVQLALTSTALSITYLYFFANSHRPRDNAAHNTEAGDARTHQEAVFLSSAIGMMMGWAWADAVSSLITTRRAVPTLALDGVTFTPRWLRFSLSVGLTAIVLFALWYLETSVSQLIDSLSEKHDRLWNDEAAANLGSVGLKRHRTSKDWSRRFYMGKVQDRYRAMKARITRTW